MLSIFHGVAQLDKIEERVAGILMLAQLLLLSGSTNASDSEPI
jgi:hypothetical protein